MGTVKGCNISDEDGFVGELGTLLSCVAINGKEKYRTACLDVAKTDIISSNPKNTSDRLVRGLFGDKIKNQANYENEYDLDLSIENNIKSDLFNANIKLLNNDEIILNGDGIKLIFYKEKLNYSYWGGQKINNCMTKKLYKLINFDKNEERKNFENKRAEEILDGLLTIHSNYNSKKIQIDIGSKIIDKFYGFRGGIRLNSVLNNSEKLIEKIKKVVQLLSEYINSNNRNTVLEKLRIFTSIEQLEEISKLIEPYDIILTQIILFYLLRKI